MGKFIHLYTYYSFLGFETHQIEIDLSSDSRQFFYAKLWFNGMPENMFLMGKSEWCPSEKIHFPEPYLV
jgi:hypothetical protein